MNRRTHLELKRNVISSSFQTWAPSFFVLSFLEIPKNFLVILKSKPDTHAYRFVDQLLKNILLSSFRDDRIEHFKKIFLLVKSFWKIFFRVALNCPIRFCTSWSTGGRIMKYLKTSCQAFFHKKINLFCNTLKNQIVKVPQIVVPKSFTFSILLYSSSAQNEKMIFSF